MKKYILNTFAAILAMTGCATPGTSPSSVLQTTEAVSQNSTMQTETTTASATDTGIDTSDIFTDRDLEQTADLSEAQYITVSDGKTIDITSEGVYVISGTAKNCTIKVNTDSNSKVQLVLDNLSMTNDSTPAIYVVSADKCFITTTDSESTLSVTGSFTADGDTNTDAVVFAKDDIVFNGTGTLNISSAQGNGISGKDDVKFTGGTYSITSLKDSIEANDGIYIADGTFNISSQKDGLHSENDDDNTVGYIYIAGGTFNITVTSDAIQANTSAVIDGGTFDISAREGIEATFVQINDGTLTINASDDGINAPDKSSAYKTPTVEINGGSLTITMGSGDTDAIDANGNITVNGGTINITAQTSSFDYDGTAEFNGGTIIINGEEVSEIPQSMMGGPGMGGMGGMRGQSPDRNMPQMPGDGNMPQMPSDGNIRQGGFGHRGNMQQSNTNSTIAF